MKQDMNRWVVRKTFDTEWMVIDRAKMCYWLHPTWPEALAVALRSAEES